MKCHHPACTCTVGPHEKYCSEECAVDGVEMVACYCGHAHCRASTLGALTDEATGWG